jgi:hypothetical protein
MPQHRRLLVFTLSLWVAVGLADEIQPAVNAPAQEKVTRLLQTVIEDYWNDFEGKKTKTSGGTETNVETAFRQASKLMPERLDLRFGIASALLSQATQTNGPQLELKVKNALEVYREIQALDTNSFEAPILYAAYSRAIGETNDSNAVVTRLGAEHPERTGEYILRFSRIDRILELTPNDEPARTMPDDNHHAIVVLGAGLETNGTMKARLRGRLEQCLKLARTYPNAPIILTGGNPKDGVTEAYVMCRWLIKKRIPARRLFLEDKARDTVENGLFSALILQRLGVTHVTLVTSSNHIRRGLADLEEACLQRGLDLQYDQLAAKSKGDTALDREQERLGTYRDVMRVSGLWAFPGLRR